MIKAAVQPSSADLAAIRPAPRRADHAPPREAFTLPEPARDAPGMERRPEPMRARPAEAGRPDRPDDAEPRKPAHPDKPVHPDKPAHPEHSARPDKASPDSPQADAAGDAAAETPATDTGAIPVDSAFAAQQAAGEAVNALTGEAIAAAEEAQAASDAAAGAAEAALATDGISTPATVPLIATATPPAPTATQAEAEADPLADVGALTVEGDQAAAARQVAVEAGQAKTAIPGLMDADKTGLTDLAASGAQDPAAATGTTKADGGGPPQDAAQSKKPGGAASEGQNKDAATAARDAAKDLTKEMAARLEQLKSEQPKPEQPLPSLTQGPRAPDSPLPASDRPQALPELPRALPPAAIPVEIGLRALQGLKEFQIRLDPAELGRVDVRLEIGEDKSVSAKVVVDRVETLHLLQRDAKTLERAFEQAGLKSSDAGIDISLRDPGQQRQGRGEAWDGDGQFADRRPRPASDIADPQPIPLRRMMHAGALDLSI